jgi:hypothetical protein
VLEVFGDLASVLDEESGERKAEQRFGKGKERALSQWKFTPK